MSGRPHPRLRGVVHQYSFFGAIAVGLVLVGVVDSARDRLALAIFTVAAAGMLGASALYHRVPWRSAQWRLHARRLDHCMIFVFIASTYTAFSIVALEGLFRAFVLGFVWAGAIVGILLQLLGAQLPRWISAIVYLAVGWAGVIALPELFSALGTGPALLVLTGGALYTLGAITYATGKPDPFPETFGFHEVFHVLVVAAATAQFTALVMLVF